MTSTSRSALVGALLLFGFATACSGSKSAPPEEALPPAPKASGEVTPGATSPIVVSLPNGPSVTVPPGAVTQPTTVTIQQTGEPPPGAYSPIYDIGPSNTQFAQPITLSIPIPAGTPLSSGVSIYVSQGQGAYQTIPTTVTTGPSGSTATGQVGQVGTVFVGQSCSEGGSCSPEQVCRAGVQTCVTGKPVCNSTGLLAKDGSSCSGGQVCALGACLAPSASGTVTATAGGTITLPGGVVVQFPPGSVPSDVAVTVRVVGGTPPPGALSPVLEFLPAMTFSQPVTVSFPISGTPPAGTSIYWSQSGTSPGWEVHPANLSVPGVATTEVTHFSQGFVGPACSGKAACTVADVCHVGSIVCSSGAPTCVDEGTPQPDGIPCGGGNTCQSGSCVAPSLVGQWTAQVQGAGTVVLTFHADGTFTRTANGSAAGSGNWSVAGTRLTLVDGACGAGVYGSYDFAVAAGSLHLAVVADSCAAREAGATVTWVKATAPLCEAGAACSAGAAVDLCKTYATACDASGSQSCAAVANQPDGTACGSNLTCRAGVCGTAAACSPGVACTPSVPDACRTYATACSASGVETCAPVANLPDGSPCGSGLTCSAGLCRPAAGACASLPGSRTDVNTGAGAAFVAIGDLNGDGRPDLVVPNSAAGTVSILLGRGGGAFGAASNQPAGDYPYTAALGDLDGDGHLDVVVGNSRGSTIGVYLGKGDGSVRAPVSYQMSGGAEGLVVTDLDGDGKADVLVAGLSSTSLLPGRGDGTLGPARILPAGSGSVAAAAADLNGDGIVDVVVANRHSNGVSVLLGSGGGAFRAPVTLAAGNGPNSITVLDVDHDGKLDIVVGLVFGNAIQVFRGRGDGTFGAAATFAVPGGVYYASAGDLNGDGNPDLVAGGSGGSAVSILLGRGDGTFLAPATVATGFGPQGGFLADLDGDARLDVVTPNWSGGSVSVLLGCRGAAAACSPGTACTPAAGANLCALYATACDASGAATCVVSGARTDGTACGSGLVCKGGDCASACLAGVACTPAGTPDPCRTYVSSCDATLTVTTCSPGGFAPSLTACGTDRVCDGAGQCIADAVVAVLPASATVQPGQEATFSATVNGVASSAVTWTVREGSAGGTVVSGLYTAPATPGTYHVDARSTANPLRVGSATVTVAVPTQSSIAVSSSSIALTTPSGSAVATDLAVSNGGAGTLAAPTVVVRHASGSGWMYASVSGASAPYTVSVRASATGMAPGTYTGSLELASAGATNSPLSIPVSFVVTAPLVVVSVSPATASLGLGEQATFTATVGATASGTVEWTVQEGPAGGIISSSGLYTAPNVPGTYHVVATSVADRSRTGTATVTVGPSSSALAPGESWITFGGRPGAAAPPAQSITVRNGGTGMLAAPTATVSYASGSGWLQASVTGSAAPFSLDLQVAGPLPAAGQYVAFVDLASPGASNSPYRVGVILYVTDLARNVTVVHRNHNVLEDGAPVVTNRTGTSVRAVIQNPQGPPGVTMPIPGVDNGDGTSTIHGVPAGAYRVGGAGGGFFEATGDLVDLSVYLGDRPDIVMPTVSTPLTFSLSGLSPWNSTTDFLQFFSYGPANWLSTSSYAPSEGATGSSAVLVDWRHSNGGLLQASDALWVSQLRWSTATDAIRPGIVYDYAQNVAAGSISGTALSDGIPASVAVTLAPPAVQGEIGLDWRTTSFEQAVPSLAASSPSHSYTLHASAAPVAPIYHNGSTLDLIEVSLPAGTPDVTTSLPYGLVSPPDWPLREWVSYDTVQVRRASGAATSTSIPAGARLWRAASPGTPATPLVGEVSAPTIDGFSASLPRSGIAAGPLVAWAPPSVGTATHYLVTLRELAVVGTASRVVNTVTFQTTQTQLQTPEWFFQSGMTYVVAIRAIHMTGYSESEPRVVRLPYGYADYVSAEFTTLPPCNGQACVPSGTPDPCKTYSTACDPSGAQTCSVSGNQPDGTSCGSGLTCQAGTCAPTPPLVNVQGTWHSVAPFSYTVTSPSGATIGSGSFVATRDVTQSGSQVFIQSVSSTGGRTLCDATLEGTTLSGTCTTWSLDDTCSGTWPLTSNLSALGSPRTWAAGAISYVQGGASCAGAGNTVHVATGSFVEADAPVDVTGTYSLLASTTRTGPSLPTLAGSLQGTWVRTASGSIVTSTLTSASGTFQCRGPVMGQALEEACTGTDSSGIRYSGRASGTFALQSPIIVSSAGSFSITGDPTGYTQMAWSGTSTSGASFCVSGAGCSPVSPAACTSYASSCDVAGNATCSPAGAQPDGTTCGTGNVCLSGSCIAACVPGQACTPAGTPDPCRTYATACDATLTHSTCGAAGNQPDGTTCGSGLACSAGTCVSSIVGTQVTTYWTDAGNVSVPTSGPGVQAIFGPLASPSATYMGTVSGGAFLIPNVPASGSYWLRHQSAAPGSTPVYVETGARTIDLGSDMLGRPDAGVRSAFTSVAFTLSGLTPWTPGRDEIECTSSNGASVAYLYGANNAGWDPFPAVTTTITNRRNWPSYAGLIDASKGDQATFHQLVSRSVTVGGIAYPYVAAENAYTTSGFTVTNGATTANTVTVPMSPIAQQSSVPVDWRGSQYAPHLAEMGPGAVSSGNFVAVEGVARVPAPGVPFLYGYGGWPDLLTVDSLPGSDVDLGTLSFGNPLPSSWGMFRLVRFQASIPLTAAGASTPTPVPAFLESIEPLATATGPIVPYITPVRNVRVNGLDASAGVRGATATPTVTWDEPTIFPVGSSYRVYLQRLATDSTGATTRTGVATFYPTGRSLQIPPGLMQDGVEYYLSVQATWDPFAPRATRPFRYGLPQATATYVSGILTTTSTRTVAVSQVTTYHPDSGPVQVPSSGTALTLTYGPPGSPTTLAATLVNGSASFDGVPWGDYELRRGTTIIRTDTSALDLGTDYLGRGDQALPVASTMVTLSPSQMAPWTPSSDNIEYVSSNAGAVGYIMGSISGSDLPGAVTSYTFDVDWASTLAVLPDPARGDVSTFFQASTRSITVGGTSYPYAAADRAFTTSTFGLVDGVPSSLAFDLQPMATTQALSVDWRGSSFAPLLADMGPGLESPSAGVSVGGMTTGVTGVEYITSRFGGWPDMLVLNIPAPGSDVNFGVLNWAPVLPSTMDYFATSYFQATKPVYAAGASLPYRFLSSVSMSELAWGSTARPIAPDISSPRAITIGGQDAFGTPSGVGLTPTIAWVGPAVVPGALRYTVAIYRIFASGSLTTRSLVLTYSTSGTSMQVPASILQMGQQYVAIIGASYEPFTPRGSAPYRQTLPRSHANAVSNVFTP